MTKPAHVCIEDNTHNTSLHHHPRLCNLAEIGPKMKPCSTSHVTLFWRKLTPLKSTYIDIYL